MSKHLFDIYLSEALISHPFLLVQGPVRAGPRAGSHLAPKLDTETRSEQILVLGSVVFYPASVQWSKSYTHVVLPWQGG